MNPNNKIVLFVAAIFIFLFEDFAAQYGGPSGGCHCSTGTCGGCGGSPWDNIACSSDYQVGVFLFFSRRVAHVWEKWREKRNSNLATFWFLIQKQTKCKCVHVTALNRLYGFCGTGYCLGACGADTSDTCTLDNQAIIRIIIIVFDLSNIDQIVE